MQTSQTGGQWYSDIPPLVFPARLFIYNRHMFMVQATG